MAAFYRRLKIRLGLIHWDSVVALVFVHSALVLVLMPQFFDWRSIAVTVVAIPTFGMAINLSYHRQLTHHSFTTPKWLEHALVIWALCSLQDTPLTWVTNHRLHHKFADGPKDPHTPRRSLLWSHCLWLFNADYQLSPKDGYQVYAKDLLKDPFYLRLQRKGVREVIYFAHLIVLFLIGMIVGLVTEGMKEAVMLGASFVVWVGIFRTFWVWHATWAVNSITHRFGYRNFETNDDSRNHWLVALLAAGEGWHNNHHASPTCATTKVRWWEFDMAFTVIRMLECFGLATNVKRSRDKSESNAPAQKLDRVS